MADKLGRGWRLVQHDGDKDRSCWWAVHGQRVHGYVQCYINSTGRRTGWEASTRTSHGGYRHLDSTTAASNQRWPDGLGEIKTFLWRTRDLAAWGLAQRPGAGLLAWAAG